MKKNGYINIHHLKNLLLAFCCLLLLTGCWDSREIDKRTSVLAIGVDTAPGGKLFVTIQVPIPLNVAGSATGGGGEGKPVKIFSAKGRTLEEAIQRIQYKVDNELFFGQTVIIAFSEKAVHTRGHTISDAIRRRRGFRRNMYPIVVEGGKAADLLKVKTDLEKIPANYLAQSIYEDIRLNMIPNLTLGNFFVRLSAPARQPFMLAVRIKDHKNMEITGLAVFRGDHMVGLLNREETTNFLRVAQGTSGSETTFPVTRKGKLATFKMNSSNTKSKFSYKNGRVYIHVHVNTEGEMEELAFPTNIKKASVRRKLAKAIEKELSKESEEMIHKLQHYDSDILDLGARIRAYHPGLWKKIDWNKAFKNAKVNVDSHVKIRRGGIQMKNYSH